MPTTTLPSPASRAAAAAPSPTPSANTCTPQSPCRARGSPAARLTSGVTRKGASARPRRAACERRTHSPSCTRRLRAPARPPPRAGSCRRRRGSPTSLRGLGWSPREEARATRRRRSRCAARRTCSVDQSRADRSCRIRVSLLSTVSSTALPMAPRCSRTSRATAPLSTVISSARAARRRSLTATSSRCSRRRVLMRSLFGWRCSREG